MSCIGIVQEPLESIFYPANKTDNLKSALLTEMRMNNFKNKNKKHFNICTCKDINE